MTTDRRIAMLGLTAAAIYVLWRVQAAQGGPIVWVNPFAGLGPGLPSTAGSSGAGGTNVLADNFRLTLPGFKLPGNTSPLPALPSSRGTQVNPIGPPDVLTKTAQPSPPAFIGDVEYLPNLGDPNMTIYDYLASTPPDWSWGVTDNG